MSWVMEMGFGAIAQGWDVRASAAWREIEDLEVEECHMAFKYPFS